MRFYTKIEGEDQGKYDLTKHLDLHSLRALYVDSYKEKYCRRWLAIKILRELQDRLKRDEKVEGPVVGVQKSIFRYGSKGDIDPDTIYLCISIAHIRSLQKNALSSITLGFVVDDQFKRTVSFWDDPALREEVGVGVTCQRCPLLASDCKERAPDAEPRIFNMKKSKEELQSNIDKLRKDWPSLLKRETSENPLDERQYMKIPENRPRDSRSNKIL